MANSFGAPRRRALARDADPLSNITDPGAAPIRRNLFQAQLSRRPARIPANPTTPPSAGTPIQSSPESTAEHGYAHARQISRQQNRLQRRPLQILTDDRTDVRACRRVGVARRRPPPPAPITPPVDEHRIIGVDSDGEYDFWLPPHLATSRLRRRAYKRRQLLQMDGGGSEDSDNSNSDGSDMEEDTSDSEGQEERRRLRDERSMHPSLSRLP